MRISAKGLAAAVLVVAMTTVACSGGSGPAHASNSTVFSGQRPRSTGTLSIVNPTNGEVVHGSTVDLKVDLQGATIVPLTSTTLTPNEGHIHVSLDDQLISMTTGTDLQIPNVSPGPHVLRVEFVATDHGPFDPRVIAVVAFQVKA